MYIRRFAAAAALAATAVTGMVAAATTAEASGVKLSQQQADARLSAAGIGRLSSGNCTSRGNAHCTSYDQINSGTVDGVITLKRASGCPVTITAGTEVGHSSGSMSHYNGYKVDISHNDCIDGYIRRSFASRKPTFGSEQYVSSAGNVYTNEGTHWDVLYV